SANGMHSKITRRRAVTAGDVSPLARTRRWSVRGTRRCAVDLNAARKCGQPSLMHCISDLGGLRYRALKTRVADVVCQPLVGRILATLWHDRIPCRGNVINTTSSMVIATVKAQLFWGLY